MIRKVLSLLLVFAMLIPIAGCGASKVEQDTSIYVPTVDDTTSIPDITEPPHTEAIEPQPPETVSEESTESTEPSEQTEPTVSEEERLKAEEEARLKAEEEARLEEERIKAEEAARLEEERLRTEQLNSFSMMYFLAITAEEIRTSKDNRLILDDIYTSLLNDINPGAIDELTQDHLKNLRDIIKSYLSISTKRERLQFIYNQEKAAAIRSAVPNPLAILSVANSFDWKKLAVTVVYTAVDSYNNYKGASENADMNFLMSGWELDDEEVATVQKNRDRAFDYMVDMVQAYGLDGMLTLNEKAIEKFAEICAIESAPERIKRLEAEEATYRLLGNYWLELADCYFETSQYTDYEALRRAFRPIRTMAEPLPARALTSVRIPYKLGCGLAGGSWEIVEKIIDEELVDKSIPVQIWSKSDAKISRLNLSLARDHAFTKSRNFCSNSPSSSFVRYSSLSERICILLLAALFFSKLHACGAILSFL